MIFVNEVISEIFFMLEIGNMILLRFGKIGKKVKVVRIVLFLFELIVVFFLEECIVFC